jgi:hypothetical protein
MGILTGQALKNYIVRWAKKNGLDPKAVIAVAQSEGGFYGAVGDHGTSFGPFQLHQGGALPKGMGGAQARAWAQSTEGINYALRGIAGVAAGKTGYAAVSAIVSDFEHPADPGAEIQRAMGYYGGPIPSGQAGSFSSGGQSAGGGGGASAVAAPVGEQAMGLSMESSQGSIPSIMAPGTVPAASAGPQQYADTWRLLATQPLASAETQMLAQRVG